ncbi:MAG: hypothetical protein ABXS91_09290 [Sulfurimonas sp.]
MQRGNEEKEVVRALAHGLSRAAISAVRGGKAMGGFLSGFAGSLLGGFVKGLDYAKTTAGTIMKVTMTAIAGGTASVLGGGKFANGAKSAAFIVMFNHYQNDPRMKRALGDPAEKADASREVASATGAVSGFFSSIKNPVTQFIGKLFGTVSIAATVNAHALDIEAGKFNQNTAIVDVMTTTTEYVKQPMIEYMYDEGFSKAAEFMFDDSGEK